MFDSTKLLLFLVASCGLILLPGPAVLYIMTRSVGEGRTAGVISVAGVGLGNLVHALAAALGLSAILASSALAFAAVKYLGAAYLIFLGLRKLFSIESDYRSRKISGSLGAAFWQGLLVGVLNPKTALFFLAVLPQFADHTKGPISLQLLILGILFVAIAVLSDSIYALLGGTLASSVFRGRRLQRSERYLSAAVYCGLGVAAAVSGSHK